MDIKIVGMTQPDKTDMEKIQEENDRAMPQQVLEGSEPGLIDNIAVKQGLDIERDNTEYDDDIKTLVQWAKQQPDVDTPEKIRWAIRDLKMRLGTPPFGDHIKHVARFAYLDLEEKRIKNEKQNFI